MRYGVNFEQTRAAAASAGLELTWTQVDHRVKALQLLRATTRPGDFKRVLSPNSSFTAQVIWGWNINSIPIV